MMTINTTRKVIARRIVVIVIRNPRTKIKTILTEVLMKSSRKKKKMKKQEKKIDN